MKRTTLRVKHRALRVTVAFAALAASALAFTDARAEDDIGLLLSAAPSGVATHSVSLRIPAEAAAGTIPIFIHRTGTDTLYGVGFHATPLRDAHGGVSAVTPAFDHRTATILSDGTLERFDVTVSGVKAFGRLTSTLYATHGGRTQTLGTLAVVHSLLNELQIASIDRARSTEAFPGAATRVEILVTIRNSGNRDIAISSPVIERLSLDGQGQSQAGPIGIRIVERDGKPGLGRSIVAAGGTTTLRLVFDGVTKTGTYTGTLRVSGDRTQPAEQSFAFDVKQGAAFPALLIALGVALSYALRRRYSSGRVGRAGQRRIVARLLADVRAARAAALEPRETLVLETLDRRLVDVSDELERGRATKKTTELSEIDRKLGLFGDLVGARWVVRAMKPELLQEPFEAELKGCAAFLAETGPAGGFDARAAEISKILSEMPAAVEATIRERFHTDVDRLVAAAESSPTVSAALPVRLFDRIADGKRLADEGRFAAAHGELGAAQLAFARALADDFFARLPEPDAGPPGFDTGWPRFRTAIADALRAVRRQRRGEGAAEAYRQVWLEYATELATRLKTAAARERRRATGSRKDRLAAVVEWCEEAAAKAAELDPATVEDYQRAVEGYVAVTAPKRSARSRVVVEDARLPLPISVVATSLKETGGIARPPIDPMRSAAALTKQIRKRHFSLALVAAIAAVPAGLALLWAPNETWGTMADGATIFGLGFGLQAFSALADARRVGWAASRDARTAHRDAIAGAPAGSDESRRSASASMLPQREPAG